MSEQRIESIYEPIIPKPTKTTPVFESQNYRPFVKRPVDQFKWQKISTVHGRSIEESRIAGNVIWSDEFGNCFGTTTWKGWPVETPILEEDEYSPYGIRTRGLKDDVGRERIEQASEIMRRHHLATERVTEVRVIEELPVGNQIVSIEEWKKWALDQFIGDKKKAAKYLGEVKFYTIQRDLQVGERLEDIEILNKEIRSSNIVIENGRFLFNGEIFNDKDLLLKTLDAKKGREFETLKIELEATHSDHEIIASAAPFRKKIREIFNWVNTRNSLEQNPERFNPYDNKDILRYFCVYLPSQMGLYLGRLHRELKIAHGFATWHNWSAVGTLYDLDSAQGKPFHTKVGHVDFGRDLSRSLSSIDGYLSSFQNGFKVNCEKELGLTIDYRGFFHQISVGIISPGDIEELAQAAFLVSYTKSTRQPLPMIRNFISSFENYEGFEIDEHHVPLSGQIRWEKLENNLHILKPLLL